MHHPCLDGVHQALLQQGPNWCHSFRDITNGRWARWWRRPSLIVADHEIGQSAWGCPCPCPMLSLWHRNCRFLVWHFVILQLRPRFLPAGYLRMLWNKYACYNLVDKREETHVISTLSPVCFNITTLFLRMQQRFSCIDNSPKTVVQYMSGKINSEKFIWNKPLSHLIPHFDGEIGSTHYSCYKCKPVKFIMCSHNEAIVLWCAVMNHAIWGVDCTGGTSGACVTSKRKNWRYQRNLHDKY